MTVRDKVEKRKGEDLEVQTILKRHCDVSLCQLSSLPQQREVRSAAQLVRSAPTLEELADDLLVLKKNIAVMLNAGHTKEQCLSYYRRSIRLVVKAHIQPFGEAPSLLSSLPSPSRRTLVLDMDKTLVFKEWRLPNKDQRPAVIQNPDFSFPVTYNGYPVQYNVKKRPHLDAFLRRVSALFEVVLFTASEALVTRPVVDGLDPDGTIFSAVLCREACTAIPGAFLKDLGRLGRCLSATLLLDDNPDSYMLHEENAIPIEEFSGREDEAGDTELLRLLPMLEHLAQEPGDVRPALARKLLHRQALKDLQEA